MAKKLNLKKFILWLVLIILAICTMAAMYFVVKNKAANKENLDTEAEFQMEDKETQPSVTQAEEKTEVTAYTEGQTVALSATIKDIMVDSADKVCISSDSAEFPGAFVVRISAEVYPIDELKGGQQITLSMYDTGEMYDEHLPLYEAVSISAQTY